MSTPDTCIIEASNKILQSALSSSEKGKLLRQCITNEKLAQVIICLPKDIDVEIWRGIINDEGCFYSLNSSFIFITSLNRQFSP